MNRTTTLVCVSVLVLGLGAPAATAAWGSHGEMEPNTIYDTSAYNFEFADHSPDTAVKKVYFNAFASNSFALSTNANVGELGSRLSPTPLLFYQAMFGIWKDCNGDNYIGLAESAVQEYRSETLLDDTLCPAGVSPHNDGEWVYEFIHLAMVDPCERAPEADRTNPDHACYGEAGFNPHPGVIYLDHVNMWGDQGHPGEELGGSSCPIRPAPRGTFSNSGLMLRYADCFVGFRIANTLSNEASALGLGFDDPKNPHQDTDHPLVHNTPVSLMGNPHDGGRTGLLEQGTGKPTATVWDCENGGVTPTTASDPTSSSAFDTADYAVDGAAGDCNSGTNSALYASYYSANLYGQDPSTAGLLEGSNPPSNVNGKDASDLSYTFYDKLAYPTGEPEADRPIESAHAALVNEMRGLLGPRTPADLGVTAFHSAVFWGPMWYADVLYVSVPQSINRATLEPSSRGYWSSYVQIDEAEFTQLGLSKPGAAYKYGEDNCGSATSGVVNGWNCDADAWYPLDGEATTRPQYTDGTVRAAVPGDLYHFRDVDCYDGTLAGALFARASLTDLSPRGICDSSVPLS